ALALNADGEKDVLGLWIEQTEGVKFWLKVVNELKARGVNDILIAVVDGLKIKADDKTLCGNFGRINPHRIPQTSIPGSRSSGPISPWPQRWPHTLSSSTT